MGDPPFSVLWMQCLYRGITGMLLSHREFSPNLKQRAYAAIYKELSPYLGSARTFTMQSYKELSLYLGSARTFTMVRRRPVAITPGKVARAMQCHRSVRASTISSWVVLLDLSFRFVA